MDNTDRIDFTRPLAGVKVLELSQIMAGPTCGLMLADLGATVYKAEKFPAGDDARSYARTGDTSLAPSFMMLNRGKRSIGINIKSELGREALLRMVSQVDVVTENFRAGVLDRLELGYENMKAVNPAIIYCSVSGYGPLGPLAAKGGFDLILQAFSGILAATGQEDSAPVKPAVSLADVNAGLLSVVGILAAYIHRLKTGQGTRVETSLLQASIQQLYWFAAAYFSQGINPKPSGTAHPLIAPYQVYKCGEGTIAIGGANTANWIRIAAVLAHPEWVQDPRFATASLRLANRKQLEQMIEGALASASAATWLERFDQADVPVSPVQTVGEALEHEQTKAVGMVVEVDSPTAGQRMRAIGLPILFNREHHVARSAPPRVGEHSCEVLREFGFSDSEIVRLRDANAVYQAE